MLVLTVIQGPDKGRRIEMPDHEPQLLGRSSEAIQLSDQTISRRHAELTPNGHGLWSINDLGSANGTFVNGVRVGEPRRLRAGDQVRVGNSLIVFGEGQVTNPLEGQVRGAGKSEMEVNLESSVAANDDSMMMSSPEPSMSAQFQLTVMYELLATIGSTADKQQLYERVMDVVYEYFSADRAFILLYDNPREPDSGLEPVTVRRRLVGAGGVDTDAKAPITYSRTIVKYVTRKRMGVLTSNAMNDTRFTTGDSVQAYGIRSAMCVPITYKDLIYGVIHLDSTIANYTYTDDQLSLLTAIGVQTGLALANLRLVDARVRAERLAAVGQTVASLSHSIKNILQGMRGGADVVELGLRKSNLQVVNNGWEIVARNLERIYELTMNMLQFSKQRKPELELQSVQPILEEVVALIQKQFDTKKVALILDTDADVPPAPVQASGIHQAVLNLVSNALDACEPEAGAVTASLQFDPAGGGGGEVVIRVTDNGEGMSPAVRDRLFEPFHSTKGYGGTGLGLVVTQKIVDEHQGKISVASEPGAGTTFEMRLPIHREGGASPADTHAGVVRPAISG
ncbi:MAG: ATP-binding protein [Planctomycetota bacterium]